MLTTLTRNAIKNVKFGFFVVLKLYCDITCRCQSFILDLVPINRG